MLRLRCHTYARRSQPRRHATANWHDPAIDGIAGEFTTSEFVDLRLYIHSDDGKSKAFVVCKAYVVDNLDAGILIGMDAMQAEGMILGCGKGKLTMDSRYGFTTSFTRSLKEQPVAFHYEITTKTATQCLDESMFKTASKNARNPTISNVELDRERATNQLPRACRTCHTSFLSSNSLHEHLGTSGLATPHRRQPSKQASRRRCHPRCRLDRPS